MELEKGNGAWAWSHFIVRVYEILKSKETCEVPRNEWSSSGAVTGFDPL